MRSTLTYLVLALVAAVLCLLPGVTSTPTRAVEPMISLDQMEPDHACLFICNLCFPEPEDTDHLVDCSNRVCGPVMAGLCAMEKFIWLGHHCRHYNNVESMWTTHIQH